MDAMLRSFVGNLAQSVLRNSGAIRNLPGIWAQSGPLPSAQNPLEEYFWEPDSAASPLTGKREGQLAALLNAGEPITTPPIAVHLEHRVQVTVILLPDAGAKASMRIQFAPGDGVAGPWRDLAIAHIVAGRRGDSQRIEFGLEALAGKVFSFRVVRPMWERAVCHLMSLSICSPDRAGRLNALSAYEYRMSNEVRHFSGVAYRHAIYGEKIGQRRGGDVNFARSMLNAKTDETELLELRAERKLAQMEPAPGETAFSYAERTLSALLPMEPPNFFHRARELSSKKPLRMLSICAGAARVEEQILDHCNGTVELTLLDASPDLIRRASERLACARPGRTVECLIGDVNAGLPGKGRFDVIVCVSALHHVADLEKVLAQINQRLEDDGEFWSIGEQIGRNGNRLWPEAYEAANRAFATLPERLRRNAHSGQVDALLSDRDFSVGSFEGIRSEELESMLESYLVPEQLYKRNAFLWRLVDATYSDNFDLANAQDLAYLRALVQAEIVHWAFGGRSTELHGIYRKKNIRSGLN
jgi:SAM-dependent methyltransferase